jgi:hypothetical protein
MTYYLGSVHKYIFHVQNNFFVEAKSDEDPDPHGFALDWLPESGSVLAMKRNY